MLYACRVIAFAYDGENDSMYHTTSFGYLGLCLYSKKIREVGQMDNGLMDIWRINAVNALYGFAMSYFKQHLNYKYEF